MPLIYSDYASSASAQMVQHRLGDFEADAEAPQPCRKRPAQVMQAPHPENIRTPNGRSVLAGEEQ